MTKEVEILWDDGVAFGARVSSGISDFLWDYLGNQVHNAGVSVEPGYHLFVFHRPLPPLVEAWWTLVVMGGD